MLSISENSYSIDYTKSSPFRKIKTKPTMNVMEFFLISWTFVLLHFNKTVNKQTLRVLIDDLKIITIIVNLYKKIKKNLKFEIQISKARSKLFNFKNTVICDDTFK